MKHTPGPWKYSVNVGPTRALIVEVDGSTVVELRINVRDSRLEANARLIASAPEMYEALKVAQPMLCSMRCPSVKYGPAPWTHCEECKQITDMLAKVEGQPVQAAEVKP